MSRYKVVDGSQSHHCCFDATVVDTTKPAMMGDEQYCDDNGPQFDSICECFDIDEANVICAALNAMVETDNV